MGANKRVTLVIEINEDGVIDKVHEPKEGETIPPNLLKNLAYGSSASGINKKMDDKDSMIVSNPCRWRRFAGQWFCI